MTVPVFPRMHVSLYVSDVNSTIKFYNNFFDQEPQKIEPGYTKYILESPSLIISFIENKDKVKSTFGHLGFQVEKVEQMRAKLDNMKDLKVATREEMGTSCCYARQDKFWVADPDGYQWEVYYFHEDVAFNDPHHEMKQDVCCSPEILTRDQKEIVALSSLVKKEEASCEPGSGCC